MGELAIGSNALQWSRGNHEFCSINLESADPDLLQVEHQGIELAKDPELLARGRFRIRKLKHVKRSDTQQLRGFAQAANP